MGDSLTSMSATGTAILLGLAIVANLAMMATVVLVPLPAARRARAARIARLQAPQRAVSPLAVAPAVVPGLAIARAQAGRGEVPVAAYDRVVRVVAWLFILSAATVVAASDLWRADVDAILVLLAVAGLLLLVVHEALPPGLLGSLRYVVEGSVGISLVTILILLTHGAASPFFYAYPLIVVGAALVMGSRVTVVLSAAATVGYGAAVVAQPDFLPVRPEVLVTAGLNLAALQLLVYVGMVVAREQRRARDAAIALSNVDPLTGLYNRDFLFAAIDREIQRSARSRRGFGLLMMDVDGLKPVNDRHGHYYGDQLLRAVGAEIRAGVRRIDTAARYGGDEFVVILPETDPTGALTLAAKIRQGVAGLLLESPGGRITTSLSIGVVTYPRDGWSADELMIRADQAMYGSKRLGKNRVEGPPAVASVP